MDLIFIEGVAAVIAAVIVFIGSIWLLLAVIVGGRLAYFITSSVALAFVFIMTLVWSYGTPLGPVGQLPKWEGVDLKSSASEIKFGPAAEYPEGPWAVPNPDDQAQITKAAELESAAIDYLVSLLEDQKGEGFLAEADASVEAESTRLFQQGDDEYGALTLEASTSAIEKAGEADPDQDVTAEDATAVVVMKYDSGNPLGKARTIAGGTFLVWVLHLFGLNRAERRARDELASGRSA